MPRQGRKQSKAAATPQPNPQVKSRPSAPVNATSSINYKALKRSELQHCCKERGLRATGKNTELVERLQAYHVKPQPKTLGAVKEAAKKTVESHQPAENTELVERLQAYPVKPQRKTLGAVKEAAKKTEESHQPAKNTELVERLQAYPVKPQRKTLGAVKEAAKKTEECHQPAETPLTVPCPDLLQKMKSEPVEEQRETVEGWCVVHGMALYRPSSSWAPLLLQRGLIYVQDGEHIVPFYLRPLNIPVPDGLPDNHICEECVLRNRKNARKVCHRTSCSQDFLSSKITLKCSTSHTSPLQSCASKIRGKTTQSRKSYRPQEDEVYAQRVDGILFQMAHGELEMDQVLHPLQPLVVHSPSPFN